MANRKASKINKTTKETNKTNKQKNQKTTKQMKKQRQLPQRSEGEEEQELLRDVDLIVVLLMFDLVHLLEKEQSVQEESLQKGAVWRQKRMFRRSAFAMFRRWKGETCILFRADGLGARISFPWPARREEDDRKKGIEAVKSETAL